jgi:membrane protein involved in colicin uptake
VVDSWEDISAADAPQLPKSAIKIEPPPPKRETQAAPAEKAALAGRVAQAEKAAPAGKAGKSMPKKEAAGKAELEAKMGGLDISGGVAEAGKNVSSSQKGSISIFWSDEICSNFIRKYKNVYVCRRHLKCNSFTFSSVFPYEICSYDAYLNSIFMWSNSFLPFNDIHKQCR